MVSVYKIARHRIPEDHNPDTDRRDDLDSQTMNVCCEIFVAIRIC
jgi:hypothetical protein